MSKITLAISDDLKNILGLKDGADETAFANAVKGLTDKNTKLTENVATLTQQVTDLQGKVDAANEKATKDEVAALLTAALDAKKITAEAKAQFEKSFESNPVGLKSILDTLKPYESVVDELEKGKKAGAENSEDLVDKFDKMDKEGKLKAFAKSNWADFVAMYEAKYSKTPAESTWKK